uniref:Heterogeneous nuclear ribonucleoprotein M n=1 Tax=Cyprinus carpio TaxID=7962 RepID=A0A8C2HGT8_CYPCA
MSSEVKSEKQEQGNAVNGKSNHESRKERPQKRGGGGRFEPYGKPNKRYRVFVSNIPYDVKWQTLKDLMKEIVGEVTYVEHLMDGEGKSRVSFRTEELMKKAVEKVNKHVMNGRPLKVKEDPDGVIAQRMGMGPGPGGPSMVNIPPSLMNNPNIPNEVIHGLQAGKIGSSIFVANLDYKVGWKKLKEVFGMAGVVVRADILEDKDGKSRGMGTVTFEMPIEAVQAVSMFNGQLLFNRVMHVKLDEKSLPKGDFAPPERPPALPRGLSGIGLGLGPGGQPIDATQLNRGGMGNMGPGGNSVLHVGFLGMFPLLPFDFTWKMLKDTFNSCGIVQYADIKMENGKSKGCGVVRFDSPETAERACRTMNGYRLSGREIDVRIDRNA